MVSTINDFLCTLTASLISSTVVYPIDVIKTRYQVYREIKFTNLYKGLRYQLFTYPTFWSIYFPLRDMQLIKTSYSLPDNVINSVLPSVAACLISNPFFVLKTRKQTGHVNHTFNSIIRNEGCSSLLRGYVTTLTSNVKLGVQLPLYDYVNQRLDNPIYASLISKTITSSVFYPFEYVRVLQRNGDKGLRFYDILLKTPARELYRGVGLYTLMTTPNFVIMMYVYDFLKKSIQ